MILPSPSLHPYSPNLMTFWVRRTRGLILGIHLQDRRSSNDVFVVELGCRFGEHDVDLAHGADRDSVDLVVLVASGDADFDWKLEGRQLGQYMDECCAGLERCGKLHLQEAGEENGVDGCVRSDTEFRLCGCESAGEGYG